MPQIEHDSLIVLAQQFGRDLGPAHERDRDLLPGAGDCREQHDSKNETNGSSRHQSFSRAT